MQPPRFGDARKLEQLPRGLRVQLDCERFHLHNFQNYRYSQPDTEFDARFFPQNCDAFELPRFWVKRKHLFVLGCQGSSSGELALFKGCGRDDDVLLPVHPTALHFYSEFLTRVSAVDARAETPMLLAAPTSSTRTLLVWPDEKPEQSLFLKTSLHSSIFGDRHIYLRTLGRSIGSSLLFDSMQAELPECLGYLPERVGFLPRSVPGGGVIARSIPPEVKDGQVLLVPLFAIIATPQQRAPLLPLILERSSLQAHEFVEEVLCRPFARMWLDLTFNHGVMLEAHAQDLLLALTPDMRALMRYYYRDFEGVQVDWDLRRRRGLPMPVNLPCQHRWYETYETIGYRQTQLSWYKLHISLFDFVDFVLHELDASLQQWQRAGLIADKLPDNYATLTFSRELRREIGHRFGIMCRDDYDIHHLPKKFALFMMDVRRRIMDGLS